MRISRGRPRRGAWLLAGIAAWDRPAIWRRAGVCRRGKRRGLADRYGRRHWC